MTTTARIRLELGKGSTVAIAGLVLLLGSGLAWAGPPNPTPSDALGNTAGGTDALSANTTGAANTAFGDDALLNNTEGNYNTASGNQALFSNTTGVANTASGFGSLFSNTGNYNTASGVYALYFNTGDDNTASGVLALFLNTDGHNNTASGFQALASNTEGSENTASGANALFSNLGSHNTASGVYALYSNTIGEDNTASGNSALFSNTDGGANTADGVNALTYNTTGSWNTAVGLQALINNTTGSENTAVGLTAGASNTTGGGLGSGNTFIGARTDVIPGFQVNNGTALGNSAVISASNSIALGNNSISAIYATVPITVISDRRHKKDIRALDADLGLDFIERLKPVSYRFNNGDETERYGFIAQDLEQALPASLHDTVETSEPEHGLALIERQNDKDHTYRVSYGELTAPMVKAIQQLQQEITEERQQIATLKAENDALHHSIAALSEQVTAAR
jgi:hypothetical protein